MTRGRRNAWRTARLTLGALLVALAASGGLATGAGLETAPAFSARTVDGKPLVLSTLLQRGPVVLDFWATWCRPCERSLPVVQKLHTQYVGRGVTVVGVSVDGPRNWARVRPFVASRGLTFPMVIDEDGSLARRFQVAGVPSSVVIAPDGRVVRFHTGWSTGGERALEDAVREALGETAAADSAQ